MDRNEFEAKKDRQQARIKSFYNYGMGILWFGVGIFFLNHARFGLEGQFDPLLSQYIWRVLYCLWLISSLEGVQK